MIDSFTIDRSAYRLIALGRLLMYPCHMTDDIDRQIVQLLRENGRRTVRDIADRVGLTVAPVKRRVDRLEQSGVITGYTVHVDTKRIEGALEAIVEMRVVGNVDLETISSVAEDVPEISEIVVLAGDPDAIARVHAASIDDLQRVINVLRTSGQVTGTKTLMVLNSWSRFA